MAAIPAGPDVLSAPYKDEQGDAEWLALLAAATPVARKVIETQGAGSSPEPLVKALADINLLPPPLVPGRAPSAPAAPVPPRRPAVPAETDPTIAAANAAAAALHLPEAPPPPQPAEPPFDGAAALSFWSVRFQKTLRGAVRLRKRRMSSNAATAVRTLEDDEVAYAVLVDDWGCAEAAAEMYSSEFDATASSLELNMGDFGSIVSLLARGRMLVDRMLAKEAKARREREILDAATGGSAFEQFGARVLGEDDAPFHPSPPSKRGRPRRVDRLDENGQPRPRKVRRPINELYAELDTRVQDVLRKDERYMKSGFDWKVGQDYFLSIVEHPLETPEEDNAEQIPRVTLTIRCHCNRSVNVSIQTHASTINIGGYRRHIAQTCRALYGASGATL